MGGRGQSLQQLALLMLSLLSMRRELRRKSGATIAMASGQPPPHSWYAVLSQTRPAARLASGHARTRQQQAKQQQSAGWIQPTNRQQGRRQTREAPLPTPPQHSRRERHRPPRARQVEVGTGSRLRFEPQRALFSSCSCSSSSCFHFAPLPVPTQLLWPRRAVSSSAAARAAPSRESVEPGRVLPLRWPDGPPSRRRSTASAPQAVRKERRRLAPAGSTAR